MSKKKNKKIEEKSSAKQELPKRTTLVIDDGILGNSVNFQNGDEK
jgi:hypothetical protein